MWAMTGYVRAGCWCLLTSIGVAVVTRLWLADPRAWIARRCLVSHDLQAAASPPARDPRPACGELARSTLPGSWHLLLAAGVLVGVAAAILLVLLVFTPSVALQGQATPLATAERERIRTAAGGTAKAAAGFAATVVAAGFGADTLVPPELVVAAGLGVGVLLLLAAEATHGTRA